MLGKLIICVIKILFSGIFAHYLSRESKVGKNYRNEKVTRVIIEGELPRKPKKPRHLGSGFHSDGRDKRKNTRSAQLRADLDYEEEQEEEYEDDE